jgi:hypothetical protein
MSNAQLHEAELIKAFVVASKQNRMIFLLGRAKRRSMVLKSLAHFRDLDPRFAHQIAPAKQNAQAIEQLLRIKGSPATCYAISEDSSIDGRFLPLKEALAAVVGYGIGTLLSCISGKLGYFEGESAGQRFVLEMPSRDS